MAARLVTWSVQTSCLLDNEKAQTDLLTTFYHHLTPTRISHMLFIRPDWTYWSIYLALNVMFKGKTHDRRHTSQVNHFCFFNLHYLHVFGSWEETRAKRLERRPCNIDVHLYLFSTGRSDHPVCFSEHVRAWDRDLNTTLLLHAPPADTSVLMLVIRIQFKAPIRVHQSL